MERTCKECGKSFEPEFSRQKNCQQCKQRDTEQKQRSRANEKAAQTPSYAEWTWKWDEHFPQQYKELRAYELKLSAQVQEELGRKLSGDEAETLYHLSVAQYCFKKDMSPWVRVVSDPNGVVVGGGFYPEVIGRHLVKKTHRFDLEKSQTFSTVYRELLSVLDKKFGKNADSSDESEGGSARAVKAELNGVYVLPAPPLDGIR